MAYEKNIAVFLLLITLKLFANIFSIFVEIFLFYD